MQDIADDIGYVGSGMIAAKLYDLGAYPAAVKSCLGEEVVGDVYEVPDPTNVLPVLDEYEGDEYKREKAIVKMAPGEEAEAWVYWSTLR